MVKAGTYQLWSAHHEGLANSPSVAIQVSDVLPSCSSPVLISRRNKEQEITWGRSGGSPVSYSVVFANVGTSCHDVYHT